MSLKPVKLLARYGNVNAGEVAGYPADEAQKLVEAGAAEWHKTDAPAAAEKKAPSPTVFTRREKAADVAVPEDWQKLPAKEVIDLAASLAEPAAKTRNEALQVIDAELAERAKAKA